MENKAETILHKEKRLGVIIYIQNEKHFGFIKMDERDERVFFHARALINTDFEELREGNIVSFMLVQFADKDKAIGVELVRNDR